MVKKWTDRLPGAMYERLCECRNVKDDIPVMINAKWKDMVDRGLDSQGYTKEDAIVSVLDILDANGQYYDPTPGEWKSWQKI